MNIALFICQHPSHVFGGELLEQMASLTQICYRNVNIVQNEVKDYIICTYDKRDMGKSIPIKWIHIVNQIFKQLSVKSKFTV